MKVAILSMEYPPDIYGGVGVHVGNMASELSKFLDVEVRTRWFPRAPGQAGVRRYRVPAVKGASGPAVEALKLDLEMVSDKLDCDIVHTHTWYLNLAGALAKKLYGIPAVATVHSLEPLRPWKAEQLGRGFELSKWMEREGLSACDRVIAVSEGMKKDIMKCYPIPSSRISVVYNGIDPEIYRRREEVRGARGEAGRVLEKLGIRKPYVLFVGRLTRQKGVFDLLEASKRFASGTQLVLVTGKPDEPGILEELRKGVRGRKEVVWMNTMLGQRETIALYCGASVAVTPSVYEPFGIVVVEAMACGAPVVASAVGGIREIVENGRSGLLVRPKDPPALADAVNRVLADGALAAKLAANGRRRVERHFTWSGAARQTFEIYKRLCK